MNEDEDFREAAENGGVVVLRIEFEDPADGFHRAGGVKGGENQVPGLGGFHAGFHGLAVADFS